MSFIFGTQDDGPSAAEILEKRRQEAERRRQGINQRARENKTKGVQGQLLGARRNPSQNLPGSGA